MVDLEVEQPLVEIGKGGMKWIKGGWILLVNPRCMS